MKKLKFSIITIIYMSLLYTAAKYLWPLTDIGDLTFVILGSSILLALLTTFILSKVGTNDD